MKFVGAFVSTSSHQERSATELLLLLILLTLTVLL